MSHSAGRITRCWLELIIVSVNDSSVAPFEKTIKYDEQVTDPIRLMATWRNKSSTNASKIAPGTFRGFWKVSSVSNFSGGFHAPLFRNSFPVRDDFYSVCSGTYRCHCDYKEGAGTCRRKAGGKETDGGSYRDYRQLFRGGWWKRAVQRSGRNAGRRIATIEEGGQ